MVPFSWLRVTATSTPGGWSQSDATKADLFLRGQPGGSEIGRAETLHQLRRKQFDDGTPILFVRFDDLRQRRTAKRIQPQKAGTECGARLASQICRITVGKRKGARHGPFARLCRSFKNERIRCIEPGWSAAVSPVRSSGDRIERLYRSRRRDCLSSIALSTTINIYFFRRLGQHGTSPGTQLQVVVRTMADFTGHLLICSCEDTMPLDCRRDPPRLP